MLGRMGAAAKRHIARRKTYPTWIGPVQLLTVLHSAGVYLPQLDSGLLDRIQDLAGVTVPREDDPSSLMRQHGLGSTTAAVAGDAIMVTILIFLFLTPTRVARSLGSPCWLLVDRFGMRLLA